MNERKGSLTLEICSSLLDLFYRNSYLLTLMRQGRPFSDCGARGVVVDGLGRNRVDVMLGEKYEKGRDDCQKPDARHVRRGSARREHYLPYLEMT